MVVASRHKVGSIEVKFSVSVTKTAFFPRTSIERSISVKIKPQSFFKIAHHGIVESWCICWAKGHYTEPILFVIWGKKG